MASWLEEAVFEKIQAGHLRFNAAGEVEYFHTGRRCWCVKQKAIHNKNGRASYQFNLAGRISRIYANRLHWMLTRQQLIPDGYFIDHKDENRFNDAADNLQLMAQTESHQQGNRRQADPIFDALCRWFDFLRQWGREPELPHEVGWVESGY